MSLSSGIKPPSKSHSKVPQSVVGKTDSDSISRSSSVSTLASVTESKEPSDQTVCFNVGEQVWVNGTKPGIIKYLGKTEFAPGDWAGVCLDEPVGKNDGSVAGVKYFTCEPNKGIFIRPHRLTRQAGSPPSLIGDSSKRTLENNPSSLLTTKSLTTPPKGALISPSRHLCSKLKVGDRVLVSSASGFKSGVLRFSGTAEFAAGEWAGVELDLPVGKNDGSVEGKRYFACEMKHGLFAPMSKISKEGSFSGSKTPSLAGSIRSRSFSRESLNSTGSVTSTKSAARVKHGVTSYGNGQKSPSAAVGHKSVTQIALQEALKEKQEHIEQLLRERDLDREEVAKAANQVEEAQQRLASVEERYTSLIQEKEAELCSLKDRCDKFEVERKQLSSKLDEERRKIEDLEFRLEEESTVIRGDLESQVAKERSKIKELEAFINDSNKNENFDEKSQEFTSMVQEKENIISLLKSDVEKLNEEIKSKDEQIKQTIASLAEAKQQLLSVESDALMKSEMGNKLKELEKQIQDISAVKTNLENELSSAKNDMKELELKNKEYMAEVAEIKTSLQTKEELITKLSSDLEKLPDIKNTKEELEKQFFEKENQLTLKIEVLLQQQQDLESKLNDNITVLNEKNGNIAQLNSELDESKKEIILLNEGQLEQISKFQNIILELKNEIVEMNTKRIQKEEEYKAELENFSKEFKSLEAKNNELNCSLEIKDNNLNKLKEELEKTKKEIALLSQGNSQHVLGLQNELSELKIQFENLKCEHEQKEQNYESQLNKFSENNNILKVENEDLYNKLASKENDIQKLQSEFKISEENAAHLHDDYKKKISTLESEIDNQKKNLEQTEQNFNGQIKDLLQDKLMLETKSNDLASKLKIKVKEFDELKMQLESANRQIAFLNEKESGLNISSEAQFLELKHQIEKITNEKEKIIHDSEEKFEVINSAIEEKTNLIMKKDLELKNLFEVLATKDLLISDLKSVAESSKVRITELENLVQVKDDILEKEVASIKSTTDAAIKQKEKCMEMLEKNMSDLNHVIETKQNELVGKQQEIEQLKSDVKEKENQISESCLLVEQNCEQLRQLKLQNEQNVTLLENKISDFKAEQEQHFIQKEKTLQEEIQKLNHCLEKKELDLKISNSEVNSLKSKEELLSEELKKLQFQFDETQKELNANLSLEKTSRNAFEKVLEQQLQDLKITNDKLKCENEVAMTRIKEVEQSCQDLEECKNSLLQDNKKHLAALVDRETKLSLLEQEVERMKNDFSQHKENLQHKLNISETELKTMKEFKDQLNLQHGVFEELQLQLDKSENDRKELNQRFEEKINEEAKQWESKVLELQNKLHMTELKLVDQESINKSFFTQLNSKDALIQLQDDEIENLKKLTGKSEPLELTSLKGELANLKVENTNLSAQLKKLQSSPVGQINSANGNEELNAVCKENESLQCQVNFLNSIIVDMKKQNEELKKKLEPHDNEEEDDTKLNGVKPPRLFCDICDVFDLHDTEDCPKQCSNEDDDIPHSKHNGDRNLDRPYCNTCEVFGHWTIDCDQEETF